MSRALPDLSRLSAHDDPATGIRERFLQPMLDGSRTVAVLTTPLEGSERSEAWLICHSFGIEQIHLQSLEVAFARRLAALGHPVLRFHARGCGDSDAPSEVYTAQTHVQDAVDLARSLLDSGIERVAFAGGLFGAAAAALAASQVPAAGLLLWEPVVDGAAYLASLLRSAVATELASGTGAREAVADPLDVLRETGVLDVQGFPLTREAADSFSAISVAESGTPFAGDCLILQISRAAAPKPSLVRLAAALEARGGRVTLEVLQRPDAWRFGQNRYRLAEQGGRADQQAELNRAILERSQHWVAARSATAASASAG